MRVVWVFLFVVTIGFTTESRVASEQEHIKKAVRGYFEMRYQYLSTSGDESIEGISNSPSEREKMAIELHHAKRYHLRYVKYDLFLNFQDISINGATATVLLKEGHDVVLEVSQEISPDNPVISSMRNLRHWINLQKENGVWKVVSDDYADYLWRMIRATGMTYEIYIQSANETERADAVDLQLAEKPAYDCPLQEDSSTYEYNRQGAVDYADYWALGRNPAYYDFGDVDCTNFVSQAIYEGGGALMTYDAPHTYGWYYVDEYDYASAWTGVSYLYDFIVPGYTMWNTGPEGCKLEKSEGLYQALEGDLIQYDWDNDEYWDHSVIISIAIKTPPDWQLYVDAHSENRYHYVYTAYIYENPYMDWQFIRIERLDKAPDVGYVPLVVSNFVGGAVIP